MRLLKSILIGCAVVGCLLSCSPGKKANKVTISNNGKIDNAYLPLRQKYASMLDVPIDSIKNIKLYSFIDEWLNTPYKWGGTDKSGIDCSAFVQKLLLEVYNVTLPRTSGDQFFTKAVDKFKKTRYLVEGDLIFFHTVDERTISHVGLYLCNRRFINASSKGVSIGNIDDSYWNPKYVSSGRIRGNLKM